MSGQRVKRWRKARDTWRAALSRVAGTRSIFSFSHGLRSSTSCLSQEHRRTSFCNEATLLSAASAGHHGGSGFQVHDPERKYYCACYFV